ncbi:MAG: lipoprotein signal peptidase [Culturomica sp.]|jgi:signal peptidase II|nr:lipoprotein signal peptidase [Culturomica sp.]
MRLRYKLLIFAAILILLDQILKIWIKTNMSLGEEFNVLGTWFRIHFTENNGMAWGMAADGGRFVKVLLTLFRIVAVGFIGWFIAKYIKKGISVPLTIAGVLIFCGAVGNIIDSVFYGVLFSDSYYHVATFLPAGGGYAPLLQGKVVDMFYFPLISGNFPQWLPFWGGEYFEFFRPIFNLADSYITIGVAILLIFYRQLEPKKESK